MLYKRFFLIVGIDNEAAYTECAQKGQKFTYNIAHKVFIGKEIEMQLYIECFKIFRLVFLSEIYIEIF